MHKDVVYCMDCGMSAHSVVPQHKRHTHKCFPAKMTCFEIMHSEEGCKLWQRNEGRQKYTVKTSHPFYESVRKDWGSSPKKNKTRDTQ